MRFKTFLKEASGYNVVEEIDHEDAVLYVENNCKDFLKLYQTTTDYVWRGMRKDDLYYLGDSTSQQRKSSNTLNYYNLFMQNMPEWDKFPDRLRSFICSSREETAREFGNTYLVFPEDGVTFGICPSSDLWASFKWDLHNEFNSSLEILSKEYGIKLDEYNVKKFEDGLKKIESEIRTSYDSEAEFTDSLMKYGVSHIPLEMRKDIYKHKDDIWGYYASILSSEGFSMKTTKNYKVNGNKELWFSGKAIFVNVSTDTDEDTTTIKEFMAEFDKE